MDNSLSNGSMPNLDWSCKQCNNSNITQTYNNIQRFIKKSQLICNINIFSFTIVNFPANYIIDKKGLRVSFIIGTACYTLGIFMYLFVEVSYDFVIFGTIFMGIGQPFLMNCPAKVSSFWFFPRNRALATSIMVATNLLGMGIGFLLPTLIVNQNSFGQTAKNQIQTLYFNYFLYGIFCLLLNIILMKQKPQQSPSCDTNIQKISQFLTVLKHIKNFKNVCIFFIGYFFIYGTFISFASNCNFLIKPYGYSDIQISINAIFLMLIGTCGTILFSLLIKKAFNFRSTIGLVILCIWLNTINIKLGTTIIISVIGFILMPIVPISYDLGCQLTFPMGEAQITGLLNGEALLWAFMVSWVIVNVIGFTNQLSSMITMSILSLFIFIGSILFYRVKIILKRNEYEKKSNKNPQNASISTTQNGMKQYPYPQQIN